MKEIDQGAEHNTVKERILKEALRLFSEKGFEGTSLQAIADAVGIQKPSLIYHFPSKENLRQNVVESLIVYWKNELPRMLTTSQDDSNRLVSTMTSLVNFFMEDVNRARLVVREMIDRPEETFSVLNEHVSPWTRLIGDYLRMGQQGGIYKKDVDPNAYIVQVMVMVVGTVAMGTVISGMVSASTDISHGPLIKELVRIVQASLYADKK
ncbi:MAG: TetR/AcrR family transcriptional regulator [Candidatus Hydrogenedentes bacterium]|jgi:AcrR family transcriptional regulator|nr:TetR/AcrR family transcriptional regulator [Candidatus Hydrogenedentota bacterium]